MKVMRTMRAYPIVVVIVVSLSILSGCSYSGDTSGYKPEQKMTKDQIAQQINQVKADPSLPAGAKQIELNNLQKQLSTAQ